MKTPEMLKKGLETCIGKCVGNKPHCPYHTCGDGCMDSMNRDALAYIQQLEAKVPKWISVEDQLPEESEDVLVFCRNDNITWNTIAHRVRTLWWRSGVPIESVTHWMPLPEPPKEEV